MAKSFYTGYPIRMRIDRLFLMLLLCFALPFQGYALAGMRACTMSHAPINSQTHSHSDHATQAMEDHHGDHHSADTSCQCSASCIGSGLVCSYSSVSLQQVRPIFAQIHSEAVLQAPTKRLDRPPRPIGA